MVRLIKLRKPDAPKRDRPIIIVEGQPYRLRECEIRGPVQHFFLSMEKGGASRYEVDMVTTSGEVVRDKYRVADISIRRSGRLVYCLSKSRAQNMLDELQIGNKDGN